MSRRRPSDRIETAASASVVLVPVPSARRRRSQLLCSACRLWAVPLGTALLVMPACRPARANPTGGQVVAGQATISTPNATTVNVAQSSQRAVVNWSSFSIAPGETTQFQQPNASAVTLNRVTGSDLSTIAGKLRANGQVILINQSGIVFSQGSEVNTGGLIATTTDISTPRFMAGQTAFTKPSPRPHASVVNRGRITVAQAGLAALVAPSVANSGVINATLGRVVLAGAQTFTADLYGDGLVSFDITSRVAQGPGAGQPLVSNTGQITADGGHILLTADAVDGIIGDLVDAGGTLQARSVGGRTGAIDVVGNGQGVVTVSGLVDASGASAGQHGGTISVLGDRVGLLGGASLTVSGQTGGGLAMIGGNFHGGGTQQRARVTYVAPTARVSADALGRGDGGSVAVWSDRQTAFYGSISARGGLLAGDGGRVEVSGHDLDFAGAVDRSSPHGRQGSLLLDPAVVNIDDDTGTPNEDGKLPTILENYETVDTEKIKKSAIGEALANGNVSIAATDSINVKSSINGGSEQSQTSLTLTAPSIAVGADIFVTGDLLLNGAVTLNNPSGSVNLVAFGHFEAGQISGANTFTLSDGSATLHGVNVTQFVSSDGVQLDGGTYTASNGPMSFGTVTVVGSLVLGSSETDFAAINLAGDTTLDASARPGGVVRVTQADATSGGQGLSMIASASGLVAIDDAGQSGRLSFLAMTGPSMTGSGQAGTATVGIAADTVTIAGPLTTGQTTTIDAGSITLGGQVTGVGQSGTIVTGLTLTAGSGGLIAHGFDEAAVHYDSQGPVSLGTGLYETGNGSGTQSFTAISTSGTLTFGNSATFGAVTLTGDTSFHGDQGSLALTFTSINAASVATPFSATFDDPNISALTLGAVGAAAPLRNLLVLPPATLDGNISASSVAFQSDVVLQSPDTITVKAPLGATFAGVSGGDGGTSLAFTPDTGNLTLGSVDLLGRQGILGSLVAASTTSTANLTGNIVASSIQLSGPVSIPTGSSIGLNTVFQDEETSGPITLGPASGSGTLHLQAGSGTVTLAGLDVAQLSIDSAGQVSLTAGGYTATDGTLDFGNVTTSGRLVLGSAETDFGTVTLAGDTTLDASARGGAVVRVAQVDASNANQQGLSILASGSGSIVLDQAGQVVALSTLSTSGSLVLGEGAPGEGTVLVSATNVVLTGVVTTDQSTTIDATTVAIGGQVRGAGQDGTIATALTILNGSGGVLLHGLDEASISIAAGAPLQLETGSYDVGQPTDLQYYGSPTTSGTLSFGNPTSFGAVTLAGDTSFRIDRSSASLTFGSINSINPTTPYAANFEDGSISDLTLNEVGGTAPLSELSVDIGGSTLLYGDVSASVVAIVSPSLLQTSVNVFAPTAATFGTVDAESNTVSLAFEPGTGIVTLGPVGQAGPLAALIADATIPLVTLNGNVTAGMIDLAGAVNIGSETTRLLSLSGEGGSSSSIVLGFVSGPGSTLDVQAGPSPISFSGFDVGSVVIGTSGQTSLHAGTYATGSGTLALGNVTTDGLLDLAQPTSFGAVTLAGDTTLDSSSVNGSLGLGQVTGPGFTLAVASGSGDVSFAGVVASALTVTTSGAEHLTSGTYAIGTPVAGGVTPYDFGNVSLSGTLVLRSTTNSFGAVSLDADTMLVSSGGNVVLGAVSGAGRDLQVQAGAGTLTLAGLTVGALGITDARTVLDGGSYLVGSGTHDWGDVSTNGSITFLQPVNLDHVTALADTTLTDAVESGSGTISVAALDGAGAGAQNVTIDAGLLVIGPVGQALPLGSLLISSANPAVLDGNVRAASVDIAGGETLGGTITIDAPNGATLGAANGTITGSGLVFTADTGAVSLAGGTLGVLSDLSAAPFTLTGNVRSESVDITGPITLQSSENIQTSGNLQLGPVTGPAATLTLGSSGGSIVLSGFDLGALDIATEGPLVLLTGTYQSASGLGFGDVETHGVLTLASPASFDALSLLADTVLDAAAVNGAITLGPVSGAGTLSLLAGSGAVSLSGATLGGLDVATTGVETLLAGTYTIGHGAYAFGNVMTEGALVLGQTTGFGQVTLGADTSLDSVGVNGALTLGQVSGSHQLTIATGTGDVTLAGVSATGLSVSTAGVETLDGGLYALSGRGVLSFGNVTTNGTLLLPQTTSFGRVTLASDTTLDMTLSSPLSLGQASGPATLTVIGGDVTFGGLTTAGFVSEATGTETLTTGTYGLGGGTYSFGNIVASGTLALAQPTSFASVRLRGDTTLDSAGVGGALTLGAASGPYDLTIQAGQGAVSLAGVDVGALTIDTSGVLTLNTGSYTIGSGTLALGNLTTNGAITFGQATTLGMLTLASDSTLATTGQAALTIGGAAGNGFGLTATAGQTNQPAGDLVVAGPIDAVGSLMLAGGSVTLDGTIGAATPVGSVIVSSGLSLTVTRSITASGDVTLIDGTSLSVDAGASVAGQTLSLGAFGGTLDIAGVLAPAGDAVLASAGDLTMAGTAVVRAGGAIRADAGGAVSLEAGSVLSAGGDVWVGYGASASSALAQSGHAMPMGVAGTLSDAASIEAGGDVGLRASGTLDMLGPVTAGQSATGGSVFLATAGASPTPGDIVLGGAVSALSGSGAGSGTVSLDAAGNIDEQGATAGSITGQVLVGQSGGWAMLGGQNRVAVLGGFQTGGQIASTIDSSHLAGTSFAFVDTAPLTIAAASYSLAPAMPQGAAASGTMYAGPAIGISQATSSASVGGPGSVSISVPGQDVQLNGSVSLSSGSFLTLAGGSIAQSGVLSLSAPLALIDVSGAPASGIAALFGAGGATGRAAFGSGQPQAFLNAFETLVAGSGRGDAAPRMQFADVEAPGSTLVLGTGQGPVSGMVDAGGLSVVSAGGGAALTGTVGGASGSDAAAAGHVSFGPDQASADPSITFDGCELGAGCGTAVQSRPLSDTAILQDLPLQPQIVTDTTGALDSTLAGLDPQQSQTVARTIELLPFDEIQQEHALDDIDVDRLDTGREDVQ